MSPLPASARNRHAAALAKAQKIPMVPLATIASATDIAAATTLNQDADTNPSKITELTRYLKRIHSENHTTSGAYNLWCGAKNQGTSATSLGIKLNAAGMKTSVYGHGSYVMQARPEEAADLERFYPLSTGVFWPANPDDTLSPQRLMKDASVNRDELGFEDTATISWSFRGPADATSQLVTASTPGIGTAPRTGLQCFAITRGPTAGQMIASTGIVAGVAKETFQGMKIVASLWVKTQITPRSCAAEIRWMDASYATISTDAGTATNDSTTWSERAITAIAPAGAVWMALQVRWTGPPDNSETHYIDDASAIEYASRIVSGISSLDTTISVYSAQLYKPTLSVSSVDATADTLTHNAHGLASNTSVYFTGYNLPAPLTTDTEYFVRNPTTNTFQISLTSGGSPIDITTTGAGTSFSKAPPSWPFRAPRGTDPTVTTTTYSTDTSACVHWIRIEDEIIGVSALSGPTAGILTMTVVRGMWGTTAAGYSADTKVFAPIYIGSISEGADATFAGSPQVNDPAKSLRYTLALEQGLSQPQQKRATEWIIKRRIMERLEYDRVGNPANIPQTTDPNAAAPVGWNGYADAANDNLGGLNTTYLDITGTSFYNQADSYGYDVRPWSLVGVPSVGLPADSQQTIESLSASQVDKLTDFRSFMTSVGFGAPHYIIGNNLAAQSNIQDPSKLSIIASGALDLAMLEFWMKDPISQPSKITAQRDQWMTICANDYKVCAWAKTGQSGLVNTAFDSAPTGSISASDISHYRRWVYAHFLMGWRGSQNQQLASEWGLIFLDAMEPEFLSFLGKPLAQYATWNDIPEITAGIKYREFTHGIIYLNTTGAPTVVTLAKPMRDLSTATQTIIPSKTIAAYDAGFLFGP